MANTYESLNSLSLSAVDVRQLTGWPDAMVNDYISLIEGLIELANGIDNNSSFAKNVQKQLLTSLTLPEKFIPDTVVATGDYTTLGEQTIICNNSEAITITLNDTPDNFEELNIKRVNNKVTINGNGRTIDGESEVVLQVKYVNLHLVFSIDTDSWFII